MPAQASKPAAEALVPPLASFWLLHVLLPGLALAGILGGFHLDLPYLTAAGVGMLGARFMLAGWLALRERQVIVWNANYRRFTDAVRAYHGPAAVPMGLAGLLGGGVLTALALAHLAGISLDAMRQAVLAQPALALVPTGLALGFYGMGFLMGFRDDGDTPTGPAAWNALLGMPGRLGGLILCALGTALLGAGVWEGVHPGSLPGLLATGLSMLAGT
ncbi:MAG TPA: hypothetical protein PLW81_02480 [Thiobacillaceae bacterium]|nr:hypothetical protein [Thiobacillaceae bacterium]